MDKHTKKALTVTGITFLVLIAIIAAGIGFGALMECNPRAAVAVYVGFWVLVLCACAYMVVRVMSD